MDDETPSPLPTPIEKPAVTGTPAPLDVAPDSFSTALPRSSPDPRPKRSTRKRPPGSPLPRPSRPRTNKATFLYRYYDDADVLLYVGVTDNLGDRTDSHARSSSWMDFAVRSTIVRFTSRREAEEHEVLAIRTEWPLFNTAHNDDPNAERRLVDYLIEHDRRDLLRVSVSRG